MRSPLPLLGATLGAVLLMPALAGAVSEADPVAVEDSTPSPRTAPAERPAPDDVEAQGRSDGGSLRAVPLLIPFQGFLRDDSGNPVDATVSLTATLYSAPAGGLVEWGPESHLGVGVSEGVFGVSLGTTVAMPTAIFDGSPLWLGVSVNGEPELPRTQLQSAPFAMRASVADVAIADDGDWQLTGAGPNVDAQTDAFVGGGATDFDLSTELLGIRGQSDAWHLAVENTPTSGDTDFYIGLEQTPDGMFHIEHDGDVGIGTTAPQADLHVAGSVRADAGLTARGSISLPNDSITSDMTESEPGVAFDGSNPGGALTGTMSDIQVVTITVPGPGYIVVQASTYSRHTGTSGANFARFQIDRTEGGGFHNPHMLEIGQTESPGTSRWPVNLTRTFTVNAAGAYTYRLEGLSVQGPPAEVSCFNGNITAMYFPTAYGNVDAATEPSNRSAEESLD